MAVPGDLKKNDDDSTIKVVTKRKVLHGVVKLRKSAPKLIKPGNWRDGNFTEDEKKKKNSVSVASSPGPIVNQLEDFSWETFPNARPLEDVPDLQQCKHCKKSVLNCAASGHIAQCLRLKKEKAQRKKEAREARERAKEAAKEEEVRKADEENGVDAKRGTDDNSDAEADELPDKKASEASKMARNATTAKKGDSDKRGKKRKIDAEAEKAPKPKKKKEEPKPKAVKPKGPVDVEKQCGVILPNGQPCARSLTCKSHSVGAKRAVPGRSLPYDMLLAAYQKKNQAKQQKAALDANAPVEDDDDVNSGPVDSDEETAAVMTGLANWNPQPVVPQPIFHSLRRQYQAARLHDQLHLATNGGRTNIFRVQGYGAQTLPEGHSAILYNEDAPGEPDSTVTFGMPGPPGTLVARRPSVSSRA